MSSLTALRTLSKTDLRQRVAAERASRHLLNFTQFTYPRYMAEPAHALIAATLDQVVAGEIKRLMIFAPPQHGKSELTSVRLPAFWLGKRPDDPVILASYGADLAYSKSRQARTIMESEDYHNIFPGVTTRQDSRAVNHWELAGHRGGLLAAGVGGPVTGHGALLGIIDDPFENWEQAQSLTIREKTWDWYRATFRTRIWEGGAIVLIMTRWHEDDLAGRILMEQADKWTVLRLPALAETQDERDQNNQYLGLPIGQPDPIGRQPGEPLSPRRFSEPALLDIKTDVGGMAWGSEYQGVPKTREGNRFKRSWFTIVDAAPARGRRVRYWDKAGTQDGGCQTAGVLIVWGADRLFYIEDVVTGHWSSGQREAVIKQTAEIDAMRPGDPVDTWVEQEPGSGGKESADSTIQNLAGFRVYADKVSGDKDVRLEPFSAQAEAGNVWLVRGAWNGGYIEELCALPNGKYRDQVDASAGGFNKVTGAKPGAAPSTLVSVIKRADSPADASSNAPGFGLMAPGKRGNR